MVDFFVLVLAEIALRHDITLRGAAKHVDVGIHVHVRQQGIFHIRVVTGIAVDIEWDNPECSGGAACMHAGTYQSL